VSDFSKKKAVYLRRYNAFNFGLNIESTVKFFLKVHLTSLNDIQMGLAFFHKIYTCKRNDFFFQLFFCQKFWFFLQKSFEMKKNDQKNQKKSKKIKKFKKKKSKKSCSYSPILSFGTILAWIRLYLPILQADADNIWQLVLCQCKTSNGFISLNRRATRWLPQNIYLKEKDTFFRNSAGNYHRSTLEFAKC